MADHGSGDEFKHGSNSDLPAIGSDKADSNYQFFTATRQPGGGCFLKAVTFAREDHFSTKIGSSVNLPP